MGRVKTVRQLPRGKISQDNFAGKLFDLLGCRIWVEPGNTVKEHAIPKIFCVAGGVAFYFGWKREGAGL